MKKTIKNPPLFMTWLEVLKFRLNPSHEIPAGHHANLVLPCGCRPKDFAYYMRRGNSLTDEAVLKMTEQSPSKLSLWLRYSYPVCLSSPLEDALIQKIGVFKLLKNGFILSESATKSLLTAENADAVYPYVSHLTFNKENERVLLSLKNVNLTIAYLTLQPLLSKENRDLLLLYDDYAVYLAFVKNNFFDTALVQAIIAQKPAIILNIILKEFNWFSTEEEILVIRRDDAEMFNILMANRPLSDEGIVYLAQHGSDLLFGEWCQYEQGAPFDAKADAVYERLFLPQNHDKLVAYLEKFYLPGKYEIRLLESEDTELSKAYLESLTFFEPETIAWALDHEDLAYARFILDHASDYGPIGEAKLFREKTAERIEQYLSKHTPGPFGQALLFKYAPKEVVLKHLADSVPDTPAQTALLQRGDISLIKAFTDSGNIFDIEALSVMLRLMPEDFILHYFQILQDMSFLYLYDEKNDDTICGLDILYHRGFFKAADFVVQHGQLSNADETALMAYGSRESVKMFLQGGSICLSAQLALIRRGDVDLILEFFSVLTPCEEVEIALLNLGEIKPVWLYQTTHGFISNEGARLLDL